MNMATYTALSDDHTTNAEIDLAGKTAPRITPEDIDRAIISQYFINAGEATAHCSNPDDNIVMGCLTICVLVLRNGFTVTGESACAHPANYDPLIGRSIALKNARDKIWSLEGYLLKQRLSGIE